MGKDTIIIDQEDKKAVARSGVEQTIVENLKKGTKVYLSKGSMTVQLGVGGTYTAKTSTGGKIEKREKDPIAKFNNCICETPDKKIQKLIENHPRFGTDFFWHPAYVDEEWTGKGDTPASEVVKGFDFAWKDRMKELKKRHELAGEHDKDAHPRDGVIDADEISSHPGIEMVTEGKKQPEA